MSDTGYGSMEKPIPNDHPSAHDEVIKDMEARKAHGLRKYQSLLQPENGRDHLQDAYEEALDLCAYLKAAIMERDLAVARAEKIVDKAKEISFTPLSGNPPLPSQVSEVYTDEEGVARDSQTGERILKADKEESMSMTEYTMDGPSRESDLQYSTGKHSFEGDFGERYCIVPVNEDQLCKKGPNDPIHT